MASEKQTLEENLRDADKFTSVLFVPGVSEEKVLDMYKDWANNGYDRVMLGDAEGSNWGAVTALVKGMSELYPTNREKVRILDVGAGTGLGGQRMKEAGFVQMDGMDPSPEMLEKAKEKNIYTNVYTAYMTAERSQFDTDSYDAITLTGVMHHGSIPCTAFEEMARIVKPGGYIVNCVRTSFLDDVPDYKQHWTPLVSRLQEEGRWTVVKMEPYPNHYAGKEGLLTVFRIC